MILLLKFLNQFWELSGEMSPYLLLGFLFAGILKVIIPKEKIYTHLSSPDLKSVIKSSILGIPLPLCSCGVIPVASHIEKEGASKGATVSFLISTPTTGVDSILATYSLLGPVFAVIRPVSAFFSGIFAGSIVNIFERKNMIKTSENPVCKNCNGEIKNLSLPLKIKTAFYYGFYELIQDTGKWILLGIFIGAVISVFVPENIISKYLGSRLSSYITMIVIGIPMYVCATGSIPIVSSLIAKGMSPGAGLVFLFTGPATNSATLTFIYGKLGKRIFFVYLSSIILWSVVFGLIIDKLFVIYNLNLVHLHKGKYLPVWFKNLSSVVLILLILRTFKIRRSVMKNMNVKTFKVPDMKCEHCVKTIKDTFKHENIEVEVNLKKKEIYVEKNIADEKVEELIKKAGYNIKKEG